MFNQINVHSESKLIQLNYTNKQELVCSENDEECMKLMCPVGYRLDREADQCELMEGNI